MAYLGRGRKEDLLILTKELGLSANSAMTLPKLKDLITTDPDYDEEFVKNLHTSIVEDRKNNEALEEKKRTEALAELKRKDEVELEKLRIEARIKLGPDSSTIEHSRRSSKEINKFLHKYETKEDFSLYLTLFERQVQRLLIPPTEWVSYLLGLLPADVSHIVARETDEKANDYPHIKEILLKRFKLTPEKFRQLFISHQKVYNRTWNDYYHELSSYFDGWTKGLKIETFEDLRNLIITDQIKQRAPSDFKEHFLDEWLTINSPIQLTEKFEEYEDIKKTLRNKSDRSFNNTKQDTKFADKYRNYEQTRRFESRKDRRFTQQRNFHRQHETSPVRYGHQQQTQDFTNKGINFKHQEKDKHRSYVPKHAQANYSKFQRCQDPVKEADHITTKINSTKEVYEETPKCSAIGKGNLRTKEITFGNKKISALIDTGSSVSLLRDNTSRRLIDPTTLNKNKLLLSGIGEGQVTTLGCFERAFQLDNETYSLTWHVVPTNKLEFEAVIGSDILKQASINIRNDGVKFSKYESQPFMQIVAENLEEEVDLHHIQDRKIKEELKELIDNYKPEKTASTDVTMRIILKDDEPVCQPPRRLAFSEKQEVNKQIEEWLKEGIIRPSSSEYTSPIVLVKKKDGTSRMCIDYRKLNQKLVKDRFPLPLIEDVLDTLQGAQVYSCLDLRNGYFHVDVAEDCRKYTSFIVPDEQYEFNKVPFGLSTSPGVFQRYVSSIFRDLTRKGVLISYMDDLIVPAQNEEEGLQKLKIVFDVAKKYGLEIKFKKCQFLKRKVEFLGHLLENGTIRPSPEKTLAVRKFPEPTTVKKVQSFLGLTGYFRKYIKNYSKIAKPLSDLTKQDNPFVFGRPQKEAFENLKTIMSEGPVLNIFVHGRKTELHTDASKHGYGAVLLQEAEDGKLHPVYYMSKKTSPAEEKYDSYELEVLAIITALKKFRVYLLGHHFKIITDCSAFQKTMSKKDLITRIARWALQLEEFDYEIEHRPGNRMQHVDALSRHPVMIVNDDTVTAKLKKAQDEDDNIQTLRSLLEKSDSEEFFDRNGILYKYVNGRELIVVPKDMQVELIKSAHENGHFSVAKTEEIIKREIFIPNLTKIVKNVITNCVPCILANKKNGKKEGFLNPIPKEDLPLTTYHIDFIGPLPSTNKNYQHILTVIDAFTKFTWLYPVKTVTAESALEKLKLQQKTFGNPIRVITDRGSAFISKAFNDYCAEEGINHLQIATGVPRGNGQVERIHRTLIPVLTKLSLEDSTKWYRHVDKLQRILNSTVCRSTNWSPFELLIGTKMRNKEDILIKELLLKELTEELQEQREELRKDAKKNIEKIQAENRRTYNKKRKKAPEYKKGDLVAIQRTQFGVGLKLRPKFLGPYIVTKVNSRDRYEVEKIGQHEGPNVTTTSVDLMKPFTTN